MFTLTPTGVNQPAGAPGEHPHRYRENEPDLNAARNAANRIRFREGGRIKPRQVSSTVAEWVESSSTSPRVSGLIPILSKLHIEVSAAPAAVQQHLPQAITNVCRYF